MSASPLRRRAFCRDACRLASTAAAAAFWPACGSDSPTAPTATTTPPSNEPPPRPPESPPPDPPPPNPVPPPSSGPAVLLPVIPSSVVNGQIVVTIGTSSPLAGVGGTAMTEAFVGGITRFVLIARLSTDRFSALNGVCTHEGCTVTRFAAPVFQCPCHGSQYAQDGQVVRGPAPASLPRLETFFDGNALTIRA